MPKKVKETAKDRREKLKQQRIEKAKKNESLSEDNDIFKAKKDDIESYQDIDTSNVQVILIDKEEENVIKEDDVKRIYSKNNKYKNLTTLRETRKAFEYRKNENQVLIETLSDHKSFSVPSFLLDESQSEQRKEIMNKLMQLLKSRYSITIVADILQCNSYEELDDRLSRRLELISQINEVIVGDDDSKRKDKLFCRFKATVGQINSRVYVEQEERMKILVTHISEGKYFERGKKYFSEGEYETKEEAYEVSLQDVISKIIDHPSFNQACEIENKFLIYECDRVLEILENLENRVELTNLIEEVKTLSRNVSERTEAYETIDKLVSGKEETRVKLNGKKEEEERS